VTAIGDGARTLVRRRIEPPLWSFGTDEALLIRRYEPADADTVLALHRDGLALVGLFPGDGVYYEYDLYQLEELYLRHGGEFLLGERKGVRVAMGGLRRLDDERAEMVRLRVSPPVQRLGFGTAMVLALEERAVELGYRMLCGDTTEYQGPALELYRRFGWEETGRRTINGIVNIYGQKKLR
jgi:ribosomal protein S18 acetylase RimI-like enzyme